jgi:hypothetical protein
MASPAAESNGDVPDLKEETKARTQEFACPSMEYDLGQMEALLTCGPRALARIPFTSATAYCARSTWQRFLAAEQCTQMWLLPVWNIYLLKGCKGCRFLGPPHPHGRSFRARRQCARGVDLVRLARAMQIPKEFPQRRITRHCPTFTSCMLSVGSCNRCFGVGSPGQVESSNAFREY